MRNDVRFRVLGPLEVVVDGNVVPVNATKQRILLAMLLLSANSMVTADDLVDQLWDQDPPRGARATLQTYVQRLRRVIGEADRITAMTGGYRMRVEPGELDLQRFREAVDRALQVGDLAERSEILREALNCWRGGALADTPSDLLRTVHAPRLERERIAAQEALFDAGLRLGRHRELVGELQAAADAAPLREKLHAQLMLALSRSGQQAEAFAVYNRIKEALATELGVDPDVELRQVYEHILTRDPVSAPPLASHGEAVPGELVPHELPADVPDFVGRDDLVGRIEHALTSSAGVPVVVVTGLPGAGKTALAVKVAHGLQNRFPDGRLYVDLRGHAATPALTPTEVLARFVIALGATTTRLPSGREELVALYRTLLRGRKILFVLDNAVSPSQVRPLLPSAPGCGVVITSRNDLRGLVALQGAALFPVDVLSEEHAGALLTTMIGAERIAAEPAAARELASLCGFLPLALRIAAANVVSGPSGSLAEYVEQLRRGNRLTSLEIEGDEEATVRTAFRLSYVALDPMTARVFRLLGLVAGPDFSTEAVAALTSLPGDAVRARLDQLTVANLVVRKNGSRHQLHDLLRVFAAERCLEDDPEQALDSAVAGLLEFYLRHTESAGSLLYPTYVRLPWPDGLAPPEPGFFADPGEATTWMDTECLNVLAAVVRAAEGTHERLVWLLVEAVRPYLVASGRYREEGIGAFTAALRAAVARGDLPAIASIHSCLGSLTFRHGDNQAAAHHFAEELAAYREAGHREGQARALIALGNLDRDVGRVDDAAARIREGLALAAASANRLLERFGWLGLSYAELLRGELDEAENAARQVIALCDSSGERATEGNARGILGEILLLRGRCHDAVEQFTRSLDLLRRGSVGHFEADVLGHLARAHLEVGDLEAAGRNARLALRIARGSAAREDEAEALTALAGVHELSGDLDEARRLYRSALGVCQQIGYRRGEISALAGYAEVSRLTGNIPTAVSRARKAVALCAEAGLHILGMRAKIVLAQAELDDGDVHTAAVLAESSYAEAQRFGAQLEQARALRVLALARRAVGDPAVADKYCRLALECLSGAGLPATAGLRRSLADACGG
ncbi:MAG TPA: BTAD domain-containing putative transcriptional regulator [Amycolatopsis sp.]|uniref:BTAD domain-containing putative transcriptional regulator n=1 Tax=Amycolatopsis nalaikhensis TaxID=715472 RepID=A0ABY8XZI5_9PSEU|nr:BTAD domain-containing putative transcriptional regulator [Amycolatopsis sp. 2-2]WIV61033.1 BTAD domain-containing putative transcriptional regulator [Amycolatopsis sp. 2-2]